MSVEQGAPAEATPAKVDAVSGNENEVAALAALESAFAKESESADADKAAGPVDTAEVVGEKADEAKVEPVPDGEENRIAAVMRAKRKAQRIREEAESAAEARAKQLLDRERQIEAREKSVSEKLRTSPLEALKELGIDPRDFLEKAISEPDKLDPYNSLKAEVDELKKANRDLVNALKEERENEQKAREHQVAEAQRHTVRQQFLNEALVDNNRALKAFYGNNPRALVGRAERLIQECIERGLDPNDIQNSEVIDYLEQEAKAHYTSIKRQLELVDEEAAQPASGNVSLNARSTSQKVARRKKTVDEMSPEEREAEARRILEAELA